MQNSLSLPPPPATTPCATLCDDLLLQRYITRRQTKTRDLLYANEVHGLKRETEPYYSTKLGDFNNML